VNTSLEPGMRVRHPLHPEWGDGQIQSVVKERVTVNFEHMGKVLINALHVELEVLD
jgi:FKBP-type peptidyl-prolyl cis-trans isomerase 2